MTPEERAHEASEMGCLLRTLAYFTLSIFGAGFVSGAALLLLVF